MKHGGGPKTVRFLPDKTHVTNRASQLKPAATAIFFPFPLVSPLELSVVGSMASARRMHDWTSAGASRVAEILVDPDLLEDAPPPTCNSGDALDSPPDLAPVSATAASDGAGADSGGGVVPAPDPAAPREAELPLFVLLTFRSAVLLEVFMALFIS